MTGSSSSFGMSRSLRGDARAVEVGLLEALLEGDVVPQGGKPADDGACPAGDEDPAVLPEEAQVCDVLGVAAAALDDADVAGLGERLDVVDGRLVELDELDELEDAVVDVQDGHVTAEASGQGGGGDDGFAHGATLRAARSRRRCRWVPCRISACRSGTAKPVSFLRMAPTGQTSMAFRAASSESLGPRCRVQAVCVRGPSGRGGRRSFFPSLVRMARTQRWHWTHRLWSIRIFGSARLDRPVRELVGEARDVHPDSGRPGPAARSCRSSRRSGTCGCPRRRASR